LSWFPDSSVVLGVSKTAAGQSNSPTRIATFTPAYNVSLPSFDFRSYDPASLGPSTAQQYRLPLISPDENSLAFFVTDERDGSTALWLAGYNTPPTVYERWNAPSNRKINIPPVASWIDAHTLIFTVPTDWNNGLPGGVQIDKLTLGDDGDTKVHTVTTLRT